MPPTLILIRHAQALHNVAKDYSIPDPCLSELGREQCGTLAKHLEETLPGKLDPELIVVSAARRCLETATLSLDFLFSGKKIPIQAHAGWQENSDKPCDTGSPLEVISKEFPAVDFSHVDPVFPDKTSPAGAHYFHTRTALLNRGQVSLGELYKRPEKVIIVVSHSGFMRHTMAGCWFHNADYRIFDFEERKDDSQPYRLVQHESTIPAGGLGTCFTEPVVIGEGLPDENGVYGPRENQKYTNGPRNPEETAPAPTEPEPNGTA